jgi:hypothetical protein
MLALLTSPLRARANDDVSPASSLTSAQMAVMMHTYVNGERLASIPFGVAGASTLAAGGLLFSTGGTVQRGAAYPLLGVGALELIFGMVLAVRTGGHLSELDHLLAVDPPKFAREETAHVHRIRDVWQPLLLSLEAAAVVAGATMAGVGQARREGTLEGVGAGIAAQGLVLFLLDWAVLDRARAYATEIEQFRPAIETVVPPQ